MTQSAEEKKARRKARKERRKLAKQGRPAAVHPVGQPVTKSAAPKERKDGYQVLLPIHDLPKARVYEFVGYQGGFISFRLRTHRGFFVGEIEKDPDSKWYISRHWFSMVQTDPSKAKNKFSTSKEALAFLHKQYEEMIISGELDQKILEENKRRQK